jgi:adenylate cyclase
MFASLGRFVFGEAAAGIMPDRVHRAIRQQQAEGELLIAWLQFFVGIFLALLYSLTPKAFNEDVMFTPVPWAVGAYLLFNVLRLFLVRRGFLANWFLAAAVLVDIALLMVLIWSFHLQYQQPASFYLKAPTVLYVFVFICLRALRFDPWFVLLAGGAAAVGWLCLLAYAVVFDNGMAMITRDFAVYITSNHILMGAEIEKVIIIGLTTGILVVAIVRARGLLIRSVAEETAARDLSRFFSPEISRAITTSENRVEPGTGELRRAAILQCDIRGFTPLASQMAPNDLIAMLTQYESQMVPVIQRHGGSIDKFLGDGIMATFGAAVPSPDYACRALRAVEDLIDTAAAWASERRDGGLPPLDIRFAVAVGDVVFGAVGDASRLEYTVIGEAVNAAAKLEKHTKVEQCRALVTADAFEEAVAQGYEPRERIERRTGRTIDGLPGKRDLAVLGALPTADYL